MDQSCFFVVIGVCSAAEESGRDYDGQIVTIHFGEFLVVRHFLQVTNKVLGRVEVILR
jgi:hypothetical protein